MMRRGAGDVILGASESTRKETMCGPAISANIKPGGTNDVEAMHHKETRSLCYQPHPEYFSKDHGCQSLYFTLIEELLFKYEEEEKCDG